MQFIHEMLEKASKEFRNKQGIVFKDKRYTFSEINEASTKIADFLISKGIKKGDRVGIFSTKNVEEIIIIFAVMKIGAVFVHINPSFKEDQLRHVVTDCDIKVLFIHESKVEIYKKANINQEQIDMLISMSPLIDIEDNENMYYFNKILQETILPLKQTININQHDPAAIIYTSGSTGKPKGIIVTHRIFYDSTVISADFLKNKADDRLISITPFSFDGALSQLFTMVYVGGTLVLQESLFPKDIVSTMINEKITGIHAVPSFWKMLLQKYSPFEKYEYPHLRYISVIGEAFPMEDLMKLRKILNNTDFYMMYGTTEAFRSTYLPPDDFDRKIPSVGKPIPGVEITIVNEDNSPCEAGEIGEIVHRGVFISPGYWNDPIKTKKVFKDGALYTGDLGRLDNEGYLYFEGRKDAMIKSMGYRISPEEIESCICKLEGVKEAVVVSVIDKDYGNRIKAIVVCNDGEILTRKEIVSHCKAILPYYMVPHIVEFRDNIPKTGTLKINRSQLS
ncbi:AMP-binding protein [Paramaledivibacter caminithermalis]|uniref:Amino acid adenylation domain-containing protein n=1 Tax=Paramaledivibacter caminithermalis (strain DSM 15212 / CIP 107654 / DViRD3) TaxID=1121301 RepID=A0A1M6PR83_PARC5|nr:AMP-binding protein [Paramaledivibacter caminithermalis]SHK10391.1 amino acid adenylation domain-containing protein [Paramaledivibacter caminithermalis DSM 15212]